MSYPFTKTEDEWRRELSSERYRVLREKGTEPAFQNEYWDNHLPGDYNCAACGQLLFFSESKYNSGTGWPSFFMPASENSVCVEGDDSYGMQRDEVVCSNCGSHLGHVFNDGPKPDGKRYCLNSLSLMFYPKKTP